MHALLVGAQKDRGTWGKGLEGSYKPKQMTSL